MTTTNTDPQPDTPEVHVHTTVQVGSERGWTILATLLAIAGAVALAYSLSLGPLRDVAATGVAIFVTTLLKYMFSAGILQLPQQTADDDLAVTKSTVRRIYAEWQALIAKSSTFRLALLAFGYTVGFLLFRTLIAWGLGVFSSVWVAAGFGALLGAVIVSPTSFATLLRNFRNNSIVSKEH